MFFDESLTDIVHAQAPYSSRGRRDTTIRTDGIYRSGGTSLLVPLSGSGSGYAGNLLRGSAGVTVSYRAPRMAARVSRSMSFRLIDSRLSWAFLPRARPISSLTRPFSK